MKTFSKLTNIVTMLVAFVLMTSCGGQKDENKDESITDLTESATGDIDSYESESVNAVTQALPQIMIIPSDGVLKNFGVLKNKGGYITRDYGNYLLKDDRFKRITSTIQNTFVDMNFPLTSLEETLKELNDNSALDLADDLQKDSKTQLLTIAKPDIVLELDYATTADKKADRNNVLSHNYGSASRKTNDPKNVSYTLKAIDAYSNKIVATISASNLKGVSTTETIQQDINDNINSFSKDIQKYFSNVLQRGRDITVRIAVENGSNITLADASVEGDTYADHIIDYIKTHTVKGAYRMQRNTDNELFFTNVRIRLLNEDGTQIGVYDWARQLCKSLRKDLGLTVNNKAQGLGEVLITIEKI